MGILLDGQIWSGDDWENCPVLVKSWDDVVEIKLDRFGHDDEPILLNLEMLEYAIKTIRSAPDFEDESAEPSPD